MTLRDLRTRAGLSQRQLAAAIGVPGIYVSRWERGVHAPRPGATLRLAKVLGVSIGDVYEATMEGVAK